MKIICTEIEKNDILTCAFESGVCFFHNTLINKTRECTIDNHCIACLENNIEWEITD